MCGKTGGLAGATQAIIAKRRGVLPQGGQPAASALAPKQPIRPDPMKRPMAGRLKP